MTSTVIHIDGGKTLRVEVDSYGLFVYWNDIPIMLIDSFYMKGEEGEGTKEEQVHVCIYNPDGSDSVSGEPQAHLRFYKDRVTFGPEEPFQEREIWISQSH